MRAMISGVVNTVKEFTKVPARGFSTRSIVPRQEGFICKWCVRLSNIAAG